MRYLYIVLLLLPVFTWSQTKPVASQNGWRLISGVGILAGETDTKPTFQLSGGIVRGRHFIGAGIGYETYRFNSFPVFADWRVDFGKKRVGFLYGNAGYNFPGHHKEETEFNKVSDKLKGGIFMDAGIGYRVRLGSFNRLAFSAGYSRKDTRNVKRYVFPCLTGDCPGNSREYNYTFGRVVAKMSWELGY